MLRPPVLALVVLDIVLLLEDNGIDADIADTASPPTSLTAAAIATALGTALDETLFRRVTR